MESCRLVLLALLLLHAPSPLMRLCSLQSRGQSVGERRLGLKQRVWIRGKPVESNVETELGNGEKDEPFVDQGMLKLMMIQLCRKNEMSKMTKLRYTFFSYHTKKVVEKYWEWELANETQPIWLHNYKEVTTVEYNEFYRITFNKYLDSLASPHFLIEIPQYLSFIEGVCGLTRSSINVGADHEETSGGERFWYDFENLPECK
ncbi:hypothetical protein YC2023_047629 [Brassica napus]